jgi:hypothetical protein
MALSSSSPNKSRPAEGERRAIRNLTAQYRVAALLIIDALQAGDLEWIRLVDPDAGRLDDVLIARPGRLDAYQIKWSDYRHNITFRQLIEPSKVSGKVYPSPFSLMAEGWQALKAIYPTRRIHAHYLTHDAATANDSSKTPKAVPHDHLQAFLRHAFSLRAQWFDPSHPCPEWRAKIDAIAAASGLRGTNLAEFLADCALDLGFSLPARSLLASNALAEEIEALAAFLTRRAAESVGALQLTSKEIRAGMGWNGRIEFRFKHDFPVEERLYQPIDIVIGKIDSALSKHQSGYLALVGPPGSGKSTTLTQLLRYREGIRFIRYYAFVRDDPRGGRGEAVAFLHDLCLSIELLGIGRRMLFDPLPESLPDLRERLGLLLSELGEEALRAGGRAIILIDGLDHIEREQNPERSLVEELPAPSTIPAGVTIILGTQPIALEGKSPVLRPIRAQLSADDRTIAMMPLSKAAVRAFADAAIHPANRSAGDDELIYEASAGHPLSLGYLVNRIAKCGNPDEVAALLKQAPLLGGDVDALYAAYWDKLSEEADVRNLLAVLARIRGSFELSTVKQFATDDVIARFVSSAGFLFRPLTPFRWAFFHNSFRQFLRGKTNVDAFGLTDEAISQGLHRRIAEIAAKDNAPTDLRWDLLFHLEQAGNQDALLSKAKQSWFRDQLRMGRAYEQIVEDIYRAVTAAAAAQDLATLARLILIHKELADRNQAIGELPLADLLIWLRDEEDRPNALMLGNELLVPPAVALDWARLLHDKADQGFAARLFDAAEPTGLLAGIEAVPRDGDVRLDAWIAAAWRFRPLEQVIRAISQLRPDVSPLRQAKGFEGDDEGDDDGDDNRKAMEDNLRIRYLVQCGIAIQDFEESGNLDALNHLLAAHPLGEQVLLRLDFRNARLGADGNANVDNSLAAIERVIAKLPPDKLIEGDRAYFSDVLVRLPGKQADAQLYHKGLTQPFLIEHIRADQKDPFEPLQILFRQSRAAAALKQPLDALSIPLGEKAWDNGRMLFQRLVVMVGTLWGEAIANNILLPAEVVRRLRPLIVFRRQRQREVFAWHDWAGITAATGPLLELALLAADAHGRAAFDAVLAELLTEVATPPQHGQVGWPTMLRRHTALAAFGIDGDRERTISLLDELDQPLDSGWEVSERLTEYHERALAWLDLGEINKAQAIITTLFEQSFGVWHHKDRQVQDWTGWAVRLVEANDSAAEEAVHKALQLIGVLFNENRGRGSTDAAETLVASLANRSMAAGREAGFWLLDQGVAGRAGVLACLAAADIASDDEHRIAAGLIAAARLILPFSGYEARLGDALKRLVASPAKTFSNVQHALVLFRQKATTNAQSGKAYLQILDGISSPNDDDDNEEVAEPEPIFTAADGRLLSSSHLVQMAMQPRTILANVAGGKASASFDWAPVIGALFKSGPDQLLRAAADEILKHDLDKPALERFATEAKRAGELDLAEKVAQKAIQSGKHYGWLVHYDGGSRLTAVNCLKAADPDGALERSLRLFASDYVHHSLPASEVVGGLDDILFTMTHNVPVAAIWREIDEHVSQLVDLHDCRFDPPTLGLSGSEP